MSNIKKIITQYFSDEHIHPNTPSETTNIEEISTPLETIIEKTPTPSISNNTKTTTPIEPKPIFTPPIPTDPELLALYQECSTCTACELCNSALNLVFGDGNAKAKIVIIGEAPGADEDEQGRPFVGRAGQLLIKILNKYGVQREDIYIANILKHRPPNNRNPLPTEITACTPFLKKQLAIINPQLLITLGNFSSQFILDTKMGITKIRGSIQESSFGMVLPTLHPSAIIRGAYPVALLEGDIIKALNYVGYDIIDE